MAKVFRRRLRLCVFAGFLFSCFLAGNLWAQSNPIVFSNNAGWCWYQDERAIINNGNLIFGSVPYPSGDNDVITYNLSSASINTFVLHAALNADDHSAPAFMVRPDGKILAVYCTHGGDSLVRYRISTNPGDTSSWSAEQNYNVYSNYGATYDNVYRLSSTGITYDFYRGQDYNPNVLVSSDDGSSWSIGGRLVRTAAGTRPYAKYASNGTDKVWFTYTDGHPRDMATNIYVAYLQGSNIYNAYGVDIGDLNTSGTSGIAPSAGTKVFYADSTHRAWTSDIQLDSNGYPVLAYSVRIGTVDIYNDHRYRYSRFDGTTWHDYEIAYAGQCLYTAENDYTGLISLNPSDPNTVYISTNANPVTGAALISSADGQRHWEVYRGFTNNNGASWTWTPITANSTTNNIRPNLPVWDAQHTALYWLKGTYTSYTNYNMSAVGYVFDGANGIWSNTGGGDWTSNGNWQSGLIAAGKLGIADFSTLNISGTAAVQLNGSRTLGFMVFGDTNTSSSGNWAVNPGSGGTITLENLGPARPTITVQNQTAAVNVSLAGTQGLDVKGSGTLILGASNNYSGGTTIYAGGTLQVGDGGALPVAGTVTNNAALVFNSSGTVTVNGVISGTGALSQNGSGTVVLGASNSYTGPTTLYNGTLKLASSGSLASNLIDIRIGTFDVADKTGYILGSGKTIKGNGSIDGAVTVMGTVSPGESPGLLTVDNMTFGSGSMLNIEIAGTAPGTLYDVLNSTGAIDLQSGSTLKLIFLNGFSPDIYNIFDIMNFSSLTGAFSNLDLPVLNSGLHWDTDNLYSDGTLSVVPEPATWLLLALGATGLLFYRRRGK